ncbi:chromosome segregation protein SMC [Rathayibacter toxicus]|nr:chromosome segregation protein SMC [Rathayibacter toxicus]QWL32454.1 chromosome segregation protein SMC [Rathayibacter toxicus]QWL34548.1 chromosome segregation protein SMC [Rathayibacter toxicus]QWL36680.1 chromosome segregation protein SMC [Rathayibacter toxicus]QWL38769.1 chromosome segregation protein SMC [Rathayibacter toxicus]QWL40857.1 chromosome segregation protein SMC [Rathayibacter toxicus]
MYLKSLTLKGFKSFAQPTTFAFEPGVTCVVGPNGSGKSNVVDALAWVMGEQGAKTLRGGKMEDVIFAGTSTRGPLGRAEVALTIDNSDGVLPIDYTEVTIKRTLFRHGGSEYAINGSTCRLLDVQELLSDSGLGREMHVIVGQGQLDAVLHATPEERRGFIEEAAGILKHRRRKEKTLRKLDAMQANLTRLSDLAAEIRRQLKPLGRQAEVARQAQTIAAVARDARARLLAEEVVNLRHALDGYARSESEQHSERVALQEKLEQSILRRTRSESEMVGDAVEEARRTTFELESVQERLRNLSALAGQRLALLELESEQPQTPPRVTPQQIEQARVERERLRHGILDAETAWLTAQQATASARVALDAVDEQIAAQAALVSQHDREVTTCAGQADVAASRLAAVRGEVLRAQNTVEAAAQRKEAAQHDLELLDTETADADTENVLNRSYDGAQSQLSRAEAESERLREELHARERERDALAARTGALSLALDSADGSAGLLAAQPEGLRGRVAEHIQVSVGFEVAISVALGVAADAVLAESAAAAQSALDEVIRGELGRVELVVADAARVPFLFPTPEGAIRAAELVTAPPGVLALLDCVVVVDDLAAVRRFWPEFSGVVPAITLVTRDGAVVSDVVLSAGFGGQRSRLELLSERDSAARRHEQVEARIDSLRAEIAEHTGALQEAKELSRRALAAVREYDLARAEHTERRGRVRAQRDAAIAEQERGEQVLTLASERVVAAEKALQEAKGALDLARSRPRPILDARARDDAQRELEATREREIEARLGVESAKERVRAEQSRTEALERQLAADRAAAEEAARRAVIRRRQREAAAEVAGALPAVLASVGRSVQQARAELVRAEADRSQRNEELRVVRREEEELRNRLQSVTESVHGLELKSYEKRLQLTGILERVGSELGLVEDVLVAEYGPQVAVPDETGEGESRPYVHEEQRLRLAKAQKQLAQLGRVNPLALEEFAALEQRHAFLTEQLEDLSKTRQDLVTIIEELDATMQTVFASAFEDTQNAFAQVFPVLFPGGTGSIRLTNPENLLSTGIDVAVRPAGKKIERLSLLSGGERSLAAVAFMVAIFTSRPSPFYIMDEVEAALDDANLGRLLTIFENLRSSSQLIIITHQKRTMEIADALYGVSMRQDGVSAVVGQRVQPTS